jgi:hypothetical protein
MNSYHYLGTNEHGLESTAQLPVEDVFLDSFRFTWNAFTYFES